MLFKIAYTEHGSNLVNFLDIAEYSCATLSSERWALATSSSLGSASILGIVIILPVDIRQFTTASIYRR